KFIPSYKAQTIKMFIFAVLSCVALAQAELLQYDAHHHQPYKFGYSVKDHHGEQHREEAGNGAGGVVGSYGFTDDRGIARQVNYVADHAGFRAQVKTNEPGTANQNPAAVQVISNDPYSQGAAEPYVSRPGAVVVPALAEASPVLGLDARYAGLGYGAGYAGLGYRGYGLGNLGYGYGGALGYTGLLGGYGGIVNYGAPLVGGAVRGYDSRFVNLAL
ncbi:cuticle protein 16.8, partial [Nephila pilipes]